MWALAGAPVSASSAITTATIADVQAFGLAASGSVVYVGSSSGLYRSASPAFSAWTRQAAITDITALSPRPDGDADLLYLAAGRAYRSVDGGQTATLVEGCVTSMARAPRAPSTIYATISGGSSECPAPATNVSGYYHGIAASTDDGLTWTTVYTSGTDDSFGPLAVDSIDPHRILIADDARVGTGALLQSRDGGHTLAVISETPLPLTPVSALAIDAASADAAWVAWARDSQFFLDRSDTGAELDQNGMPVDASLLTNTPPAPGAAAYLRALPVYGIQFDPLSDRVYVNTFSRRGVWRIYAYGRDGRFAPFGGAATGSGALFQLTHNGYILTGDSRTPLTVSLMNAPGAWPIAAPFAPYYGAVDGVRLLGLPLSPAASCDGALCQYFEKGRLEAGRLTTGLPAPHVAYGQLVIALAAARAPLPVGGDTSTVTYATLNTAAQPGQRVRPPAHFRRGIATVAGGTFVPYSPTFAPQPGYVVPPYFWRYVTRREDAPDGWLRDLGLPMTPIMSATVTKGTARRVIEIQAFQRAVLTYDRLNPGPFRVERANVGDDYATVFPQAVR